MVGTFCFPAITLGLLIPNRGEYLSSLSAFRLARVLFSVFFYVLYEYLDLIMPCNAVAVQVFPSLHCCQFFRCMLDWKSFFCGISLPHLCSLFSISVGVYFIYGQHEGKLYGFGVTTYVFVLVFALTREYFGESLGRLGNHKFFFEVYIYVCGYL